MARGPHQCWIYILEAKNLPFALSLSKGMECSTFVDLEVQVANTLADLVKNPRRLQRRESPVKLWPHYRIDAANRMKCSAGNREFVMTVYKYSNISQIIDCKWLSSTFAPRLGRLRAELCGQFVSLN